MVLQKIINKFQVEEGVLDELSVVIVFEKDK